MNLSLLVSLSVFAGVLADVVRHRSKALPWLQGLLFGGIVVLLMFYRVQIAPGIVFDGRTGVLFLGSWFFGAPAALVASVMALTFRFFIGGDGMWLGVASICLSSLAGLIHFREQRPETQCPGFFVLLRHACILHFLVVMLFFFMLPLEVVIGVWWIFLFVMPAATAFAGKMIAMQLQMRPMLDSLKTQDQRLRMITDNMREVFWVMDMDTLRFSYLSHSAYDYTGYTVEEAMRLDIEDILTPTSLEEVKGWLRHELPHLHKPERAAEFSSQLRRIEEKCKDGSTVWSEISMSVIHGENNKPIKILGISRNISERVQMEEALQRSLNEKEALLKEVHHRVKNNLQVITSILRLESHRIDHPYTRDVLGDMQRRIRSIALLHEMVYQSHSFAAVNMRDYLRKLLRQISVAMSSTLSVRTAAEGESPEPPRIEARFEVEDISLPLEKAIPCGLLANELLSNAYKHAFGPGESGFITLVMRKNIETEYYELYVMDTGRGLPEDLEKPGHKTLGMQLISDLILQLEGTSILERGPPVRVGVTFADPSTRKNHDTLAEHHD
ncbi:MAG: PAS domain S-box protein [Verrucomicrobia bacterium]|nr:PAS domain S-box protein [Verrucomicrobiota bacterium]MCH8512953.1 PAS domain S-box protein [Kiritimatiellia bacterium]